MRRVTVIIAAAGLQAACSPQTEADATAAQATEPAAAPTFPPLAAAPGLAGCPARPPVDEGLRERTEPVAVPPVLSEIARTDLDNFALTTLNGATTCVDVSWVEEIRNPTLSADGRFAAFDWTGYESFGHVIVDRAGGGRAIDTGVPPVVSPSGKLLAAADLGEAGFGALNAFALWRIEPSTLRELAKHDEVPHAYDWRIDKWAGETCVDLSAVPAESLSTGTSDRREPYRAREASGWKPEAGRCIDA